MTRKTRNLFVAAAVVAVLSVAALWIKRPKTEPNIPEQLTQTTEQIALSDFEPGSLRNITIDNAEGTLSLSSMDGQTWIVNDVPEDYRFKDALLRSLVSNLSSLRGVLVESNLSNPEMFGLETPEAILIMADNTGKRAEIQFGNSNPSDSGRYASVPGNPGVYLVGNLQANKAFWSVNQLRSDRLPELNLEAVTSILIKNGDTVFRTEPHDPNADPYRPLAAFMDVVEPWKGRYLLEDHAFQQTIGLSPPPRLISAFPENQPEDPDALGLGPEADRIRIETADGDFYDLEIGVSDGEARRYARESSFGDTVFLVDEQDLGLLDLDPFKQTSQFVYLAGIANVREIRIEGIGPTRVLSIEKLGDLDDDSDDVFRIDGIEIGEKDFKDAYQAVIGLLYEGVAQSNPVETEPELTIRFYHVDTEVPPKSISFLPYNQTYFIAGADDEAKEFIIGRYQIDGMLDALDAVIGEGP